MAKAVKKTRRLKKSVRKTLGTLFLISALVVAAIPTEGLQASPQTVGDVNIPRSGKSVTVDDSYMTSIIPKVPESAPVYTTADRAYQFAYVQSGNEYIAILLGFNKSTILENQTLTIPGEVDAYKQYNTNEGTDKGYVAVGRSGNFLFYDNITTSVTTETKKEVVNGVADTEVVYTTTTEHHQLYPCGTDTASAWEGLGNERIYYQSDTSSSPTLVDLYDNVTVTKTIGDTTTVDSQTTGNFVGYTNTVYDQNYQRLTGAAVRYIGNQTLEQSSDGQWHASANLITSPEQGVFYNCSNFSTLNVGPNLQGLGNYAFYGCGALKSITLGDNLRVIGNSAFQNCQRLEQVNLNVENLIQKLGDHAFAGCSALLQFTVPISVTSIGDSAFEGCSALTDFDLCSGGTNNQLQEMGWDVFKNCSSLKSVTFPASFDKTLDISTFVGCFALEKIAAWNGSMTFTEGNGYATSLYSIKKFREQLADDNDDVSFYFEGLTNSALYQTAKKNFIAFSHVMYNSDTRQYEKQDKYELTVDASTDGSGSPSMTYMVNSSGTLIGKVPNGNVTNLVIPNKIGPYGITAITDGLFRDYCYLETVTIPAAVKSIGSDAFKGCHNLENVIFKSSDLSIGAEAFKTQENSGHELGCTTKGNMTGADNLPTVQLHFTGEISPESAPFNYAMSSSGRYNNSSQKESYITYYSGWPRNLEVKYVVDDSTGVGKSTLVDFPVLSDLGTNTKYTKANYAYITDELETAAKTAPTTAEAMRSENQVAVMDAARNLVIPDGVDDILKGLYLDKETQDLNASYTDPKAVISYGLKEIGAEDFAGSKTLGSVYLYSDVATIAAEAFKDCTALTAVEITGNNQSIGDHAFENCTALTSVSIPPTTTSLGVRPFAGCTEMGKDTNGIASINFQNSPYFTYENSMIYGTVDGVKVKLIECLEGKSGKYVRASELSGITELESEAFAGTGVKEVDLSTSMIVAVPTLTFADTANLNSVKLPSTCMTIADYAFKNSAAQYIEVPAVSVISSNSFADMTTADKSDITLCVTEGSYMDQWGRQNGYDITYMKRTNYYEVTFYDWNEELGKNAIVKTETVEEGNDATPPEPAGKTGYIFSAWDPDYHEISADTTCFAQYITPPDDYGKYRVTFTDYDDTVLKTVLVEAGGDATELAPKDPTREGYMFTGWDRALTNVTENFTTKAVYEKLEAGEYVVRYIAIDDSVIYTAKVKYGENAPNITGPAVTGKTFAGWRPALTNITKDTDTYAQYTEGSSGDNNGGTTTATPTPTPTGTSNSNNSNNNGTSSTTYTLTVVNGSGSGSYVAGAQPIIVANNPASGMEFSSWTITPSTTKIASTVLSATIITMPETNVTVTANYVKKSSSSTNGSSSTASGNNTSNGTKRPGTNSGTVKKSGTTVVIDKNGLSNTGVVSATVNGSSDNFTIKITESSAASEAVLKALMAEYGNVTNIKYFPMDISLYDSTGTNKITDTTGLSVSITLPLPDSLITYAGNNKVAGVVNDRLDKLNPKFTTIDGVSCVTFVAEHFSPYVIYVDTANLSSGTISDNTPKTGDGIHPKWFLSIGLACVSFVLFMQRDNTRKKKVKARAV